MHVAALAIVEVGPLRSATGGVDAARSVRRVAAREAPAPPPEAGIRAALRVAGVGRRRLALDLDYHLRHTALPAPGSEEDPAGLPRASGRKIRRTFGTCAGDP